MDHKTTRLTSLKPRPAGEISSLVLIYGAEHLGKRYSLEGDLTVGRDSDNGIILDLDDVSRHHARIAQRHGIWTVTDLGSTNGTHINDGPAVGEVSLVDGDLIKIGGAILKYLAGGNVEAQFHEEIYRMTIFDGLTGAHNRRYFDEFLDREVSRSERYGARLSLAMIDLDFFKKINDAHGHPAGDHVLERVAGVALKLARREQLFARYGGEEFALVLPELEAEQTRAFCERFRDAVASENLSYAGKPIPVTVSIGVATLKPSSTSSALIAAADAELYRAKKKGRNCVVLEGDVIEGEAASSGH